MRDSLILRTLSHLLWTHSSQWLDGDLDTYFRSLDRPVVHDPRLLRISHYRRFGKLARFEFLCTIASCLPKDRGVQIWIPYTVIAANREYLRTLQNTGWEISQHLQEYSDDDQEAWDTPAGSDDEKERKVRGRARRVAARTPRNPRSYPAICQSAIAALPSRVFTELMEPQTNIPSAAA